MSTNKTDSDIISFLCRLAILFFIVFVALGLAAKAALAIKFIYPVLALIVAGLLYRYNLCAYVGFTWWIWILTPFLRRVVDYNLGYDSFNPIAITPYLVTLLTVFSFLRKLTVLSRKCLLSFSLILIGVWYSYFLGIIKNGLPSATFELLMWISPIFFSIYLITNWSQYPSLRYLIQKIFLWAVLIMGIYGIWQFISPFAWDTYWMRTVDMRSAGAPIAFKVRVFSTLNAFTPFAWVMMAGLLLLFSGQGFLCIFAAVVGYVAFLLSLVRSAWGAWFLGAFFIAVRTGGDLKRKSFTFFTALVLLCIFFMTFEPVQERLNKRFQTFISIREEVSFYIRVKSYLEFPSYVSVLGEGFGLRGVAAKLSGASGKTQKGFGFDSGLLHILFVLGLFGAPAKKTINLIPLGRLGKTEDIAKAALFLACEDSDFITGQTLIVDGGMSSVIQFGETAKVIGTFHEKGDSTN